MKKIITTAFAIALSFGIFAQPLQLRPEVVELYRLQDIALRSRVLEETDFIEKHKAFFNHPLFCENAFGFEYVNFANALLLQGEHAMAEKYLLKSARLRYVNTSNANIDPRIIAIAHELAEMREKGQVVRRDEISAGGGSKFGLKIRKVDSINIYRLMELIKENPDIDIMRINMLGQMPGFGGNIGTGGAGIIVWRLVQFPEFWADFFEPFFRKRAEAGRGLDYVLWYDRQYFERYRIETFGQFGFGMTTRPFIFICDNLDEINDNRERVGLLPLSRR